MKKQEIEILLLSAKCLINLFITLEENNTSHEEYEKELGHLKESAMDLLYTARENSVIIPKEDRLMLYEIIKS